jgi:hypothetical protein
MAEIRAFAEEGHADDGGSGGSDADEHRVDGCRWQPLARLGQQEIGRDRKDEHDDERRQEIGRGRKDEHDDERRPSR